jgi:hypothetical protein
MQQGDGKPELVIVFPKSETELRVVFSEPVDRVYAEDIANYKMQSGLSILAAHLDQEDPRRVTLVTEPMNGEAMQADVLSASGVRTHTGEQLARGESPEFIQGIVSIPQIQKPAEGGFPFTSRFEGKLASASCGKDGGVDSNVLISTFGFAFIHMENGGPFNSLKIVTNRHIPGIAEATRALSPGQTVHVLWAGGEIRTVDGETQLVDTGFMEGSIILPNPLVSPPPFPIKTAELAGEAGYSVRAKSLQGVVVRFENVTIDRVSELDKTEQRTMQFHDDSGGQLSAVLLGNVKTALQEGQTLQRLRGLVHQPQAGKYEIIVELDQHLVVGASELFGHVTLIEGYALPAFEGCHALVALRDTPGTTVVVLTTEHRLQSLLEIGLQTGHLIAFWGDQMAAPPTPRGGTWAMEVYEIDGVIVYDRA